MCARVRACMRVNAIVRVCQCVCVKQTQTTKTERQKLKQTERTPRGILKVARKTLSSKPVNTRRLASRWNNGNGRRAPCQTVAILFHRLHQRGMFHPGDFKHNAKAVSLAFCGFVNEAKNLRTEFGGAWRFCCKRPLLRYDGSSRQATVLS